MNPYGNSYVIILLLRTMAATVMETLNQDPTVIPTTEDMIHTANRSISLDTISTAINHMAITIKDPIRLIVVHALQLVAVPVASYKPVFVDHSIKLLNASY